jgi:hypothetical protein
VIDGPFTETKEPIAGYCVMQVRTFAEAVEWAKRAPFGLDVQDGEEPHVGLRPLFDPSDFDVPGEADERAKRLGENHDQTRCSGTAMSARRVTDHTDAQGTTSPSLSSCSIDC